jgi:hypothetical protein
MKCRYSETDVALYVEGDLAPVHACDMQAHLLSCEPCRDLASSLRESQAVLKGLRQDTVSAAALSSVRARVLAEVSGTGVRSAWGRWVYAVAGAVFVAVVCVGFALQMREPVPSEIPLLTKEGGREAPGWSLTPESSARATTPSAPSAQPPLLRKEGNKTRKRPIVPQAEPEVPAEPPTPLMVKLLTDDPNIVIYWLVDQKDGGTL